MMRLGALEQRILLACLARHEPKQPTIDVWRAELPGLLWGWDGDARDGGRRVDYRHVPPAAYRAVQASLTRALASLRAKGLVRFTYGRWGGREWVDATNGIIDARTGRPENIIQVTGRRGQPKGIRLTPLGLELIFLRLPWKPDGRRAVTDLTSMSRVKSTTAQRRAKRRRRQWIELV